MFKVLTVVNLSSLALSHFPHVCDLKSKHSLVCFVCLLKTNKKTVLFGPDVILPLSLYIYLAKGLYIYHVIKFKLQLLVIIVMRL